MLIGVVSDTHNHLSNVERIVELFDRAGVERVVHTGDVTQAKTLDALARMRAPLVGVYGNNDEREALRGAATAHGMRFSEGPLVLEWAQRRIVVVHDPRDLESDDLPEHEVALHGHTHLERIEHEGGRLVFNPGECAGHLRGYNRVGVLDLRTLQTDLLHF